MYLYFVNVIDLKKLKLKLQFVLIVMNVFKRGYGVFQVGNK